MESVLSQKNPLCNFASIFHHVLKIVTRKCIFTAHFPPTFYDITHSFCEAYWNHFRTVVLKTYNLMILLCPWLRGKIKLNYNLWYIFSKLVCFGFTKYKKDATNRKTFDTPFMLHFLKCRIEILFVARYEILFVNLARKEVMNLLWVNFSCLFCNYIDDSELVMIE